MSFENWLFINFLYKRTLKRVIVLIKSWLLMLADNCIQTSRTHESLTLSHDIVVWLRQKECTESNEINGLQKEIVPGCLRHPDLDHQPGFS
jgi:hypothetical protein